VNLNIIIVYSLNLEMTTRGASNEMSFYTEKDRQVLNMWLGEKEAEEVLKNREKIAPVRSCDEDRSCDEGESLWVRGSLSEGHDHFYQTYFASIVRASTDEDSDFTYHRFIKAMKGMNQHPDIPVVSANGVVSVDLEAVRRFFAEYFEVECKIVPLKTYLSHPFHFNIHSDDDDDDDREDLFSATIQQQRSLTTYQSHQILLRDAFVPVTEKEKTATIGVSAIGKISCDIDALGDIDALDILALADPCDAVSMMQEDASMLKKIDGEKTFLYRNSIEGLQNCDFQRILRRAGVPAETTLAIEELRETSKEFLENLMRSATTFCKFSRRKVVTADDVLASRPLKSRLLGFGGPSGVRNVWSTFVELVLKQVHPYLSIGPKAMSVLNDINSVVMEEVLLRAKDLVAKKPFFDTYPSLQINGKWIDKNENDRRAFGYKVVSIGSASQPFAFSTKIYTQEYRFSDDEFIRLDNPLPVISSHEIKTAVMLYCPGDIKIHALKEGEKAVTKFKKMYSPETSSFASAAGLQLSPEKVALIASRMTMGFPMTECAAVYLAAIMEYITAEVLELSGNASRDSRSQVISCRDVFLAKRNDEELNKMFENCIIREGGVIPHIKGGTIPKRLGCESDQSSQITYNISSFDKLMIAKAKDSATAASYKCAVFVDPRTGKHMGVYTDEDDEEYILNIPELDKISQVLQEDRRMMAEAALSETEVAVMKAEGFHTLPEDFEDENKGWAPEPLNKIHRRRLVEIRREQCSNDYIFNFVAFKRLVCEIGQQDWFGTDLQYTQEAMEAAQAYLESYLVDLADDAILAAIHDGRCVVQSKDLQLARRLCEK